MNLKQFLNAFDFDYEKGRKYYRLIDLQGANLGGIEQDRFETIEGIIDRMDTYYDDYIVADLVEEFGMPIEMRTFDEMLDWCESQHNERLEYEIGLLEHITGRKQLRE